MRKRERERGIGRKEREIRMRRRGGCGGERGRGGWREERGNGKEGEGCLFSSPLEKRSEKCERKGA